jgi:aminobenzoyl-glutamate utilization protein B
MNQNKTTELQQAFVSRSRMFLSAVTLASALCSATVIAQDVEDLKWSATGMIDENAKLVQEMVDSIFSFAEPGFQEFETSAYITNILEENGFEIEHGVSGIPTAWTATWSHGTGKPKIALGSDIDALLGLSQFPGVPEIQPMIPGAPGHGEGHNSGMPAMVAAAIAVRQLMIENNIDGTLMVWPGVAEELLATKAFYVRDGMFDDVDANIFSHVSRNLGTFWGPGGGSGLVSVEFSFTGQTSHAAGAPWRGRSALDAVEIMNVAWNFRREHLPLTHRSHYVITGGGGQPNIVPGEASVWYYFRDTTFQGIRNVFEIGERIAEAAAMATDTTMERRILGYAAPQHGNRPMAEAAYRNIEMIGLPEWSEDDLAFARAVQQENTISFVSYMSPETSPLETELEPLSTPETRGTSTGGGSDDIGDIMWTVPTITIRYPSNVPNTIGHHVTAAMAMATPIAHKGAVAGAKAVAMTTLDLLLDEQLLADAWHYFENDQLKGMSYDSLLTDADVPAIHLNTELMDQMRPLMREYYYDPSRYDSYLEQLGIPYPPQ